MRKARLICTDLQAGFIKCTMRFICLMAGRRWGKTFAIVNRLFYRALKMPGFKGWYVAPTYAQAIKVFEIFTYNVVMQTRFVRTITKPIPTIYFRNGSKLEFRSADKPEALRGDGVDELVCDEIQSWKMSEDQFNAILRPLISDTLGTLVFAGQHRGKETWVYKNYFDPGLKGEHDHKAFNFPSRTGMRYQSAAGVAELELVKTQVARIVYDQEYECIPTANQDGVFMYDDISACTGGLYETFGSRDNYLINVDLGRMSDPSAITVINETTGTVCYSEIRELREEHEKTAKYVARLRQTFNNAACYIDSTGGATGGRAKPDEHVKYYRQHIPNVVPFFWNRDNKTEAVYALSLAFEQRKIKVAPENRELLRQLSLYEYKVSGGGKIFQGVNGKDDDLVASLLMGWITHAYGRSGHGNTNSKNAAASIGI